MILVVIDTASATRAAEALRAAVGLGLRGAPVQVCLRQAPRPTPECDRALAMLESLGQRVRRTFHAPELAAALREADKIEVWT